MRYRAVGLAASYKLDSPDFESQNSQDYIWGNFILLLFGYRGSLLDTDRDVKLTSHFSVQSLRMCGAIPLVPPYNLMA